jgi:hypothetical protein
MEKDCVLFLTYLKRCRSSFQHEWRSILSPGYQNTNFNTTGRWIWHFSMFIGFKQKWNPNGSTRIQTNPFEFPFLTDMIGQSLMFAASWCIANSILIVRIVKYVNFFPHKWFHSENIDHLRTSNSEKRSELYKIQFNCVLEYDTSIRCFPFLRDRSSNDHLSSSPRVRY